MLEWLIYENTGKIMQLVVPVVFLTDIFQQSYKNTVNKDAGKYK